VTPSARRLFVAAPLAAGALFHPSRSDAQEPIFVTPPVTMYQGGLLAGAQAERHGGVTTASVETAIGLLPAFTLAIGALGSDGTGDLQLARVHLGARLRLVKVDRPAEWVLLSVYGLGALPLGGSPARASEALGVPDVVLGVSATRMARGGDVFADLSIARSPGPSPTLSTSAGFAFGWRPAPQAYGRAELQLFAELKARYAEGGSAVAGVAPGVLVHTQRALVKLGVLFPMWERQAREKPRLLLALKLLG
jgi:hypothetical protein